MDFLTYSTRLDHVLELIKRGSLTSPHDLTEKFDCSERTIRKMIDHLKTKGYNIRYSRRQKKYYVD